MAKLDMGLLAALSGKLEKQGFVDIGAQGPTSQPPPDPAAGAPMAPPPGAMDPAAMMGGQPGMAPVGDPAAAGGDPAAAGGSPAPAPAAGQTVMVNIDDLRRLMQEGGTGGGGGAASGGSSGGSGAGGGKKKDTEVLSDEVRELSKIVHQLVGMLGGAGLGTTPPPDAGAGAGAPPPMAPPAGAPPPGAPPSGAPPPGLDAMMGAGQPSPSGGPSGGMTVQASLQPSAKIAALSRRLLEQLKTK